MWPQPGESLSLEDHTSCEVLSAPSPRGPFAASALVRHGDRDAVMLVLERRPGVESLARAVPLSVRGKPSRHVVPYQRGHLSRGSAHVGYRESARVAANPSDARYFLFAPMRGLPLGPLVAAAREGAPWSADRACALVATLAVRLLAEERTHFDPLVAGLDELGVWALHPALDALLRAIRHDGNAPARWLGYLAPEALRGELRNEHSASFGLGVLLHELIAGQALFDRSSALATVHAVVRDVPAPLSRLVPGTPLDVAACAQALLERDPLRRPSGVTVYTVLSRYATKDEGWMRDLVESAAEDAPFLSRL